MKYESDRRSSPLFVPTPPREKTEPPVCRRSERCKDCPHARHGFICWHRDGTCLKTDMEEIEERKERRR
jgi:hypothetical protein